MHEQLYFTLQMIGNEMKNKTTVRTVLKSKKGQTGHEHAQKWTNAPGRQSFIFPSSCCQFLWIVHFWLPLRYSLTFICFMHVTRLIKNGLQPDIGINWLWRPQYWNTSNVHNTGIQIYTSIVFQYCTSIVTW